MTSVPGVTYHATSGGWRARGHQTLAAPVVVPIDRDTLEWGTYVPGPDTTGPVPGTAFQQMNPTTGLTYINFDVPNTTYDGLEIWGEIRVRADGVKFKNCLLHGRDPDTLTQLAGIVKSYDTWSRHAQFIDCRFDPLPWVTERGSASLSPQSTAIHGGNVDLIRCEVLNVQDGWNYVGQPARYLEESALIESNWFHHGYFENGFYGPSDGRTHSDAFQFNTGRNITIRGNMLGGQRDPVGYGTAFPNGHNTGDDFWNTAIQIAQESSDDISRRIMNVIIEKNFIAGGTASINITKKADAPSNDFSTMTIRNNQFFQRQNGWGISANKDGGMDVTGTGFGRYILRNAAINAVIENNTIYETGALAPVAVIG